MHMYYQLYKNYYYIAIGIILIIVVLLFQMHFGFGVSIQHYYMETTTCKNELIKVLSGCSFHKI